MIGSECMQALHFVSNADYILVNGSIRMRDSLAHIRVYSMRLTLVNCTKTGRRIYAGETWPYGTGLIISCPGAIISCSKQPRRAAECSTIQELYQLRYGNHCRILQQLMHLASCMFCPLRADHPACTGRSWSSVQKLEVV
ncbi:uncharacterized protein [Triticum aestivum]|uniref:uncharacterized protein isoform X1 n=1 Tax=Triticum aestivum TaxID=4565 RepID=UPI001D00A9B3|nr:uncharacterized protein LOC123127060 isoform X1 [Triticum aestivum]